MELCVLAENFSIASCNVSPAARPRDRYLQHSLLLSAKINRRGGGPILRSSAEWEVLYKFATQPTFLLHQFTKSNHPSGRGLHTFAKRNKTTSHPEAQRGICFNRLAQRISRNRKSHTHHNPMPAPVVRAWLQPRQKECLRMPYHLRVSPAQAFEPLIRELPRCRTLTFTHASNPARRVYTNPDLNPACDK